MPRQVITIGDNIETIFRWTPQTPRPDFSDLSAEAGQSRYLIDFQYLPAFRPPRMLMYFGAIDSSTSGRQDLTEKWETFESAIVIRAGSLSLYIPGPNYSGNVARDDNGFYLWSPPSSISIHLDGFITAYNALSQSDRDNTTMELRDSYINLTKGDTSYNKVYVGNTEQKKIYKGDTLVHDLRSNG